MDERASKLVSVSWNILLNHTSSQTLSRGSRDHVLHMQIYIPLDQCLTAFIKATQISPR